MAKYSIDFNTIYTLDQPVYTLTKEIQWRFPEQLDPNSYFTLLGLKSEHCILVIEESGLYEILMHNDLSITDSSALANANHIKQGRYCLQVSLCAGSKEHRAVQDHSHIIVRN